MPRWRRSCNGALDEEALRVVKLHCAVGDFAATDPRLAPVWEAAVRRSVPVVLHAGRRAPGATAADEIDALAPLLAAYPALPLVLAHAGYPHAPRTLQLVAQYANLYADVTPVWEQRVGVGAAGADGVCRPLPVRQ